MWSIFFRQNYETISSKTNTVLDINLQLPK